MFRDDQEKNQLNLILATRFIQVVCISSSLERSHDGDHSRDTLLDFIKSLYCINYYFIKLLCGKLTSGSSAASSWQLGHHKVTLKVSSI